MGTNTKTQKSISSDDEIMDLYWARDDKAIVLTADKYGRFLYRIAYNILHDPSDCEECQNDVYFGIWNAIPPSRPQVFPAFISKIMRNTACKKYKEKTRKKRIPSEMIVSLHEMEDFLHSADSVSTECSADELGEIINDFLSRLSERQQCIFIGRFYMGDTLEVIAEEFCIHVSTVHREIEKIKHRLKSHLERRGIYV